MLLLLTLAVGAQRAMVADALAGALSPSCFPNLVADPAEQADGLQQADGLRFQRVHTLGVSAGQLGRWCGHGGGLADVRQWAGELEAMHERFGRWLQPGGSASVGA
ncbi:hypothetical protein ACGF3J_36490 [Streptomyces sp. NPDC048171]|uniref:hypothetical protein n=1 Tax=Streptomyces sp. NPDC048171 TaxID=3365504 RepID=UPI00371ED557